MERKIVFLTSILIFISINLTNAQNTQIKEELESFIYGGCNRKVNIDLLNKNSVYSATFLSQIKTDTLKCIERKKIETTCQLFNLSQQKKEIVKFLFEYLSDSTTRYSGYIANCIYDKIHELELPKEEIPKMNLLSLKRTYTRNSTLLLAYLEIYESVPILENWLIRSNLKSIDKEIINVALARLNSEIALNSILKFDIVKESDWLIYFAYLNFIRTPKATEELVKFVYDDSEIILEELPDLNSVVKCKISALSLYHLSMIIVDFPVNIKYMNLYEDLSKETELAKKWLDSHKDYKTNRKLGSFKL